MWSPAELHSAAGHAEHAGKERAPTAAHERVFIQLEVLRNINRELTGSINICQASSDAHTLSSSL